MMRVAELCAGYGGLAMAIAEAGVPVELAWYAETDPDASAALAHHHPGVPNLGDITVADFASAELVDILAAGFPCQDISVAGNRLGISAGTRSGLWSHVARAIAEIRPPLVFLENVEGLRSARADSHMEPCPWCVGDAPGQHVLRALGAVLGDLATLGFDAEWTTVAAADVGAAHRRNRVFILAWPADSEGHGLGDGWSSGIAGVPATTVAGGVGPDGVSLLPTPASADGDRSSGMYPRGNPTLIGALLPTPGARLGDGRGAPDQDLAARRLDEGRRNLDDAVALLPTPAARDGSRGRGWTEEPERPLSETVMRLLPTPAAGDGSGGPGIAGREGSPNLRTEVTLLPTPRVAAVRTGRSAVEGSASAPSLEQALELAVGLVPREIAGLDAPRSWGVIADDMDVLLPTPRASDGVKGGPNQRGSSGDLMHPSAVQPERWGQYSRAIARWACVVGRPAPEPTEPGRLGQPRLSPAFVEWLMGLPAGHVTDHVGRSAALRILGNGVVPAQGAHGFRLLLAAAAAP